MTLELGVMYLFCLLSLSHICTVILMVHFVTGKTDLKSFNATKEVALKDIKQTFWRDFASFCICILTELTLAYQVAILIAISFLLVCSVYAFMCLLCRHLK